MQWTTVNAELILTNRQPSGYDYRIRLQTNGSALLVAEGRISDGKPTTRRVVCTSVQRAMDAAELIENAKPWVCSFYQKARFSDVLCGVCGQDKEAHRR